MTRGWQLQETSIIKGIDTSQHQVLDHVASVWKFLQSLQGKY